MRYLRNFLISLLVLVVGGQLFAKYYLGLGDLPIYVKNKYYEYIYAPNQEVYRFHNRISTNAQSMRSKPLSDRDRIRILKFGDSVINGGVHVDQDRLASSILEHNLSAKFHEQIRVLNISAQSWGPDNAFAYLKQNGNFGSKFFVLVFSSHDLHDNMHFRNVVGEHKAWPDSKPWCALTDGINRYLIPKIKSWFGYPEETYDYLMDFDDSKINPGWREFFEYTKTNGIELLVYVHATRNELKNGAYDKYGQELMRLLNQNQIRFIEGIKHLTSEQYYRDMIHLNEKGQGRLAAILEPYLDTIVSRELQSIK